MYNNQYEINSQIQGNCESFARTSSHGRIHPPDRTEWGKAPDAAALQTAYKDFLNGLKVGG